METIFLKVGNFDQSGAGFNDFAYGYGLYKIEFWKESIEQSNDFDSLVNYCYLDCRDELFDYIGYNNTFDIRIDFFADSIITFRHYPFNIIYPPYYYHINDVDHHIKMWELHGTFLTGFEHRLGLFSSTDTNYNYLQWPINANKYNGNIGHENPGDIGMNLVINHYVTTQDTLQENPTNFITAKNGFLKIASGKTFDMITAVSGSSNLIIQDSSLLLLSSNSNLIVRNQNKLTLQNKSQITLYPGSNITFLNGSSFCNLGGKIFGPGIINYKSGSHILCREIVDYLFNDSAKLVLSDSAILEIPDSTILHFTGKQSGLVMNPHSKLKMGIGSKIIFDSSASIYADGAEFSSTDSLEKWEGIFLYDSDADTIKNCTFSNSKTALTIINDPEDAESVYENRIITDNTFNIPNGDVHMGIYGENNYRILIQKNDFNMPVYYPSGSPVQLLYAGVYLKNSSSVQPDSGDVETNQETNYSLNIEGNSFSNGCASLILANYTQAICLI